MTDLVERLRNWAMSWDNPGRVLVLEAADEIERLRAALQAINDLCKTSPANPFLADNMDRIAIAALRGKSDD